MTADKTVQQLQAPHRPKRETDRPINIDIYVFTTCMQAVDSLINIHTLHIYTF